MPRKSTNTKGQGFPGQTLDENQNENQSKNGMMECGPKAEELEKSANGAGKAPLTQVILKERRLETDHWRSVFLARLATNGNVKAACRAAGVTAQTAYRHRQDDRTFRLAWRRAKRDAVKQLEAVAWKRATTGYVEATTEIGPAGRKVIHRHRRSDSLLALLLKANCPEKYRERQEIELTTSRPEYDPELQRAMLADPEIARLQAEIDARVANLRQAKPALPGPVIEVPAREGDGA